MRRSGRLRLGALLAVLSVAVSGALALMPTVAEAAIDDDKDTIAVLFSYPWNDVAEHCETTLGPAGYGYVQTSPPQEHVQGTQWWTYYQPVSYDLNSRLGTEDEFRNMVERCNSAGVKVIADAVINHMTGQSDGGIGFGGTPFEWFDYPGIYDQSDFNNVGGTDGAEHPCDRDIQNYKDRWEVQTCRLVGLADLDTGKEKVRDTLAGYLEKLASLGVSGFRVDAVKHIPADDLQQIWTRVQGHEDLYVVQEVISADGEPIRPEEYVGIGDVHEFGYSRALRTAFQGNQIGQLLENGGVGLGSEWNMLPGASAAVFVDNHDTERNGETLSYKDGDAYQLAQAFTLAWPYGSPSVHSGYEFTDYDAGPVQDAEGMVVSPFVENGWTFMHARAPIVNMVGFRNHVRGTELNHQWTDQGNNAIAFGRGDRGFVIINNNSEEVDVSLPTDLPDGIYYNLYRAVRESDGSWSGPTVTVSEGRIGTPVAGSSAIALRSDVMAQKESVDESSETPAVAEDADSDTVTVYFKPPSSWSRVNIHYTITGDGVSGWTEVPGLPMARLDDPDCSGWYRSEIRLQGHPLEAVFNNGEEVWQNAADGGNFLITTPIAAVEGDRIVTVESPCAAPDEAQSQVLDPSDRAGNSWVIAVVVGSLVLAVLLALVLLQRRKR